MSENQSTRGPLTVRGVIFGLALNTLLVSSVFLLGVQFALPAALLSSLLFMAAVGAGLGTASYIKSRAAMHVFIGGMLSAVALGLFIFGGNWPLALLIWGFCLVGGIAGEMIQRRR
jgi:uncharacterized oligopeptide transporter (OPT) family protein